VHFYPNWRDAPRKYRFPETLDYIGSNNLQLDVVARTGFRLLCGDEKEFENCTEIYQNEKKKNQDNIVRAITRGGNIRIYLQRPTVVVPAFSIDESNKLRLHQEEAVKSFDGISDRLLDENKKRFQLHYTNTLVDNSMTRVVMKKTVGENVPLRLVFDISVRFASKHIISKPFVVFERGQYDFSEYLKEFDYIIKESTEKAKFEKSKIEAIREVRTFIDQYGQYSSLRNDRSELIVPVAANSYLKDKKSPFATDNPPICIQLLVTNECTTRCSMCDHYKLYKQNNLITDDIKSILDSIKVLGTRNVVISGGEPLARADIIEILKHAKLPFKEDQQSRLTEKDDGIIEYPGLNVGLLTNGIKKNGETLSKQDCEIFKNKCSWIQVSIDSFDSKTYEEIRGYNYLNIALETIRNLHDVGFKNIEVCYTIQKLNIKEVPKF